MIRNLVYFFTLVNCLCFSDNKQLLSLRFLKDISGPYSGYSLKIDFLQYLAHVSGATIFIETGTHYGNTAYAASLYFQDVHTIEFLKEKYEYNVQKFKNVPNVHVYHGNSTDVLSKLLPNIQCKIVFWLDAHTKYIVPVLQELEIIKQSCIENSIILIDDVHLFDYVWSSAWPPLNEVRKAILSINPHYHVEVLSDILIAYLPDEVFEVSPVVHACTISRLFGQIDYAIDEIIKAEQIIADAQGEERIVIRKLAQLPMLSEKYSQLWYGLVCMKRGLYAEAEEYLTKSRLGGLTHWRIFWYLANNALKVGNTILARDYLELVCTEAPEFECASKLLDEISKI